MPSGDDMTGPFPVASHSQNFCFVLNRVQLEGVMPCELIPGHSLDRATKAQQDHIRGFLGENHQFGMHKGWYENRRNAEGKVETLPPEQWRYWVVNFRGNPDQIGRLKSALSLNAAELEIGFLVFTDRPGILYTPGELMQFFLNFPRLRQPPPPLHVNALTDVRKHYDCILNVEGAHPSITRSLMDFQAIRTLPRESRFAALGYFMVLESLLTHNPAGSSDGLTHQVSTKMPLIERRFTSPLDYTPFGQAL